MKNTRIGAAVALPALCAAAVGLAACGSGESPQALLQDTFSGSNRIESGKIDLSFGVSATGSNGSTQPLSVVLSGPFQSQGQPSGTEPAKLPLFALKLNASAAGHPLSVGATATGSALYVELGGTWFSTPPSTYKAIEESFAKASRQSSSSKARSTFSSLGIEPGRWLSNPSNVGTTTVGGVSTVHLSAEANVPAFLADVTKISQAGSALGLPSPAAGSAISSAAVGELAKSIRSAHVDVYTGKSDHVLRRLEVTATVTGTSQTRSLLGGLSSARVKLLLEFSDVNNPQSIAAPPNPQSPSQLLPALQSLFGVLQGTGTSGATLEPLVKG